MSYYLRNIDYEYIKIQVADTLKKSRIDSLPIDPFRISKNLDIQTIKYSDLSLKKYKICLEISSDGFFIESSNCNEIIYYNDLMYFPREIWTVAHELGHDVLDHEVSLEGHTMIEEKEANFFAKYIMAPPPLIDLLDIISPESIMETFGTSRDASTNIFNYYWKWKRKNENREILKDYDLSILSQFTDNLGKLKISDNLIFDAI